MAEEYINYLNTQFKRFIESCNLSDLSFNGVHEDLSYDDRSDLKITCLRLTGTIASGIITQPYQILCEVNSAYKNEMKQCLDELALDLNEDIITLDSSSYKQFYSTAYTLSNFQQNGLVDKTTLCINATLIKFGPVDIQITVNNDSSIEAENVNITWTATPASAGALKKNEGTLKRVNRDVAMAFSFSFIPKNTDVQKNIAKHVILRKSGLNAKYTLVVSTCGTSETFECVLASGIAEKNKNGATVITATFTEGDFGG